MSLGQINSNWQSRSHMCDTNKIPHAKPVCVYSQEQVLRRSLHFLWTSVWVRSQEYIQINHNSLKIRGINSLEPIHLFIMSIMPRNQSYIKQTLSNWHTGFTVMTTLFLWCKCDSARLELSLEAEIWSQYRSSLVIRRERVYTVTAKGVTPFNQSFFQFFIIFV